MNTPINDGGPAFPGENAVRFGQPNDCNPGMTLRDYFAAKAMQAAATNEEGASGFTFHQRAEWAYMQADAMIKARSA